MCTWARSRSSRNSRSEEHTSELQSHVNLVCRLLLEKKKYGTVQTDQERIEHMMRLGELQNETRGFTAFITRSYQRKHTGLGGIEFFFVNDTATPEIYTLSLHDALPISRPALSMLLPEGGGGSTVDSDRSGLARDRKSTRLNSSHMSISYAVFCLKKKKTPKSENSRAKTHTYNIQHT